MGSYGALWAARVRMMRSGNALMAAIGTFVGASMVLGGLGSLTYQAALLLAPLAAFLVTGFGNIINDIVDRDIDQIAHPKRPLPANQLTVADARASAVLVLGVALWIAWLAHPWAAVFAAVNALLLLAYEWRLKRTSLLGNLTVGMLVASVFPFGALAVAGAWPTSPALWGLAGLAFLVNVAREMWKDVEDRAGDVDRRTFGGEHARAAKRTGQALVLVAVVLSAFFVLPWRPASLVLLLADGLFVAAVVGVASIPRAQRGLKLAMLLALVAFAM